MPLELLMIRYLLTLTGHDLSVYSIYVKLCYKIYRETNIRVNETLSIVIRWSSNKLIDLFAHFAQKNTIQTMHNTFTFRNISRDK